MAYQGTELEVGLYLPDSLLRARDVGPEIGRWRVRNGDMVGMGGAAGPVWEQAITG